MTWVTPLICDGPLEVGCVRDVLEAAIFTVTNGVCRAGRAWCPRRRFGSTPAVLEARIRWRFGLVEAVPELISHRQQFPVWRIPSRDGRECGKHHRRSRPINVFSRSLTGDQDIDIELALYRLERPRVAAGPRGCLVSASVFAEPHRSPVAVFQQCPSDLGQRPIPILRDNDADFPRAAAQRL